MTDPPEPLSGWWLRYWQYRLKHEKLTAGHPREIDAKEVYDYARDIERALKRLPKSVLRQILDAHSPEEVAAAISALPHHHSAGAATTRRQLTDCGHCVLLGGWAHRNAVWPRINTSFCQH